MQFRDFDLIEPLLRAVDEVGYQTPTPIQVQAIPPVLAGRDLMGCAQTGTGKTAAFSLPLLQRLQTLPKTPGIAVLVLTPTRELAAQIGESFSTYGKYTQVTNTVIFGGVGQEPQVRAIRRGVNILVATPGRLLDLIGQRLVRLDTIKALVLDEADRMLDMGFIRDVQKILAVLPTERQTLFFSATLAPEVIQLARTMLHDPVHISVTPPATTVEKIAQSVYFVEKDDKRALLHSLLEDPALKRVIVFSRTKHGANKVMQNLERARIGAAVIHGNKSQNARTRALEDFKAGQVRVLVATDIAARGIDIDGITHVVNYDLPNIPDSYVHRIGRTARASAEGVAIAFCEVAERPFLRDIERLIRKPIPVVAQHAFASPHALPQPYVVGQGGSRPPAPTRPQEHHQRPQHAVSRPQHSAPRPQHSAPRPQQAGSRQDPHGPWHERAPQPGPRPQPEANRRPALAAQPRGDGFAPPRQERIARDWW